MIQLFPTAYPPQTSPVVDKEGKINTATGGPFFAALWQRTGGGTGIVNQAGVGLRSLAGTILSLASDWNEITADGGSGVILPALTGGQSVMVFNNGAAGSLLIDPPAGAQIDALPTPYFLPTGKMQIFFYFSSTNIRSCQLG